MKRQTNVVNSSCSVDGKSSPRIGSRQRAVLLPLLKEKDEIIGKLEEKVSMMNKKQESCQCEDLEKTLKENLLLKKTGEDLQDQVEDLVQQVKLNEEKMFELETMNMKLAKNLEFKQNLVDSLQIDVDELSSKLEDKIGDHEEEEDLESLIEKFVEKVGVLCSEENLKLSVASEDKNVKIIVKTRARNKSRDQTFSPTFESTHLCVEESTFQCQKPGRIEDITEIGEHEEASGDGRDLVAKDTSIEIEDASEPEIVSKKKGGKVKSNKTETTSCKVKAKSSSQVKDVNSSMRLKLDTLTLDDDEDKTSVQRQTRSMARKLKSYNF